MVLPASIFTVKWNFSRPTVKVSLCGPGDSAIFPLLNLTLMPAALAIVIVSTSRLAQEFLNLSVEPLLAAAAAIGILVFHVNAPLLLVAGGVVGAFTIRERRARAEQTDATKPRLEPESSERTA